MKKPSRLEELWEAGIDYSVPINAFAMKARALFNKHAKEYGLRSRVSDAKYSDGAACLSIDFGHDQLSSLAALFSIFSLSVHHLALENKKLAKLNLLVEGVRMYGSEIYIDF